MKNRPDTLLLLSASLALPVVAMVLLCGPAVPVQGGVRAPAQGQPTRSPQPVPAQQVWDPAGKPTGKPAGKNTPTENQNAKSKSGVARPGQPGPCPSDHSPVLRAGFDSSGQCCWWHVDGSITTRARQERIIDGRRVMGWTVVIARPQPTAPAERTTPMPGTGTAGGSSEAVPVGLPAGSPGQDQPHDPRR